MIRFNCPNCNNELVINKEDREYAFCEYCGQKISLEKYRREKTEVSEEDIFSKWIICKRNEAETKQTEMLREKCIGLWIMSISAVILISFFSYVIAGKNVGLLVLLFTSAVVIIGGAYMIFLWLPYRTENNALKTGVKIRFPKNLEPFEEKNYKTVRNELYNAGFTDISCVNLHDVKIGIMQKPDRIASITVGGKMLYFGGKAYYPDVKIVIRYHGR